MERSKLYEGVILTAFLGGSVVKNPPASARDTEDVGSVLRS